ncbi:MAG TPA: Hsp20/alpha crystallin family protein [Bryobacteraceae bacterium]|nr:Hsp20/alpha crystallin family protein [Bryobacteraceae bacterium]
MPEVKVAKDNGGAVVHRPEVYFPKFPFGSLLGTTPFGLMKRFSEEMDRMFTGCAAPTEFELWAPPLEVKHKEGNFIVTAELPGIAKEDIKVEVIEESLVIEGEKKAVKEEKEEGYYRSERSYGKFYRSIPLPKGAKPELIKAELTNGILKVVIPVPEVKPALRQVPITTAK